MHLPSLLANRLLYAVLVSLSLWSEALRAGDPPPTDSPAMDFATVSRALDGQTEAIEALLTCAQHSPRCRIVAAAALHRDGRIDEVVAMLRPAVARGDQISALALAEIAFKQEDYELAWAVGNIWMEANDLVVPEGPVEHQGMRVPWLIGQSTSQLGDSGLERARKLVDEIRSSHEIKQPPPDFLAQDQRITTAIERPAPQYPQELQETGAGGWAVLVSSVSAGGAVEEVRELFSSHSALAEAGMESIRQWRYEPVEQGPWWSLQSINFEFEDWQSSIPEEQSGIPDEQGWIRFDDARGWIEFTVRVNGVRARAMLDSGAQSNAISRRLAERANISLNLSNQVRVTGIYGQRDVPLSGEFEIQFGQAIAPMRGALVLPVSSPDLVLGVGLFQAGVVQIDYPNKRIRFLDRDVVQFEGNVRSRGTRRGSPQVQATLNGRKVWMLFDTGNSGPSLFKRRLIERMGLDQYQADLPQRIGHGAVSSGRSRMLQLPDFELGPFPFETLLARYIDEGGEDGFESRRTRYGSRLRQENAPYDGILGSEVLENFIITADLRQREIHFTLP